MDAFFYLQTGWAEKDIQDALEDERVEVLTGWTQAQLQEAATAADYECGTERRAAGVTQQERRTGTTSDGPIPPYGEFVNNVISTSTQKVVETIELSSDDETLCPRDPSLDAALAANGTVTPDNTFLELIDTEAVIREPEECRTVAHVKKFLKDYAPIFGEMLSRVNTQLQKIDDEIHPGAGVGSSTLRRRQLTESLDAILGCKKT